MGNLLNTLLTQYDFLDSPDFGAASWTSRSLFEDNETFEALKSLRTQLYPILGKRSDASMDLIDALACQQTAQSVTDLCEQPQFLRRYASVTDAIHYASLQHKQIKQFMMVNTLLMSALIITESARL